MRRTLGSAHPGPGIPKDLGWLECGFFNPQAELLFPGGSAAGGDRDRMGNPWDVPWDLPCPGSRRAELPDDVSTWNDTIPRGRREEMGLIPAGFPPLPSRGIHRAPKLALPKKTARSWNEAALGVLLEFQPGESGGGSRFFGIGKALSARSPGLSLISSLSRGAPGDNGDCSQFASKGVDFPFGASMSPAG